MSAWSLVLFLAAVTALSTSIGAVPALAKQRLAPRTHDVLMGFSAGVMLAATAFSLLIPSINLAKLSLESPVASGLLVALTVLGAGLFLHLCNIWIPHEHFVRGREGGASGQHIKRIWLFVFAIALHNFPEGLAVGSGGGSMDLTIAIPILVGIALQDIPEGFVVAVALIGVGYTRTQSVLVAVITGLIEALGTVVGFFAILQVQSILPWSLAFCGGSMLYVVVAEIIPESQRTVHAKDAVTGLMIGFVLMMFLDTALGH